MTQEQAEKFVSMWQDGASVGAIAKACGCSERYIPTLANTFRKRGVKLEMRGGKGRVEDWEKLKS